MLNEAGGVLDDLIIYRINPSFYRIVVNAGTREKDLAWMRKHAAAFNVELTERTDFVMLAIQGPAVKDLLTRIFTAEEAALLAALKPFTFAELKDKFVARTGYTGEDGYEIIFPAKDVTTYGRLCWLLALNPAAWVHVTPCAWKQV